MARILILSVAAVSTSFVIACGGSAPANSSVNANANTRANVNSEIRLDPANMPPGLSGSPVPLTPGIPGIPVNAGPLPKGTPPIPGIPSEAELKKKKKLGPALRPEAVNSPQRTRREEIDR